MLGHVGLIFVQNFAFRTRAAAELLAEMWYDTRRHVDRSYGHFLFNYVGLAGPLALQAPPP